MKPIIFLTVPQKDQRYLTLDDYVEDEYSIVVKVSKQEDWRHEALISLHGFVEKMLCMHRGITEKEIEHWDAISEDYEPGENPNAPYHKEHMFAESMEKRLCEEMGINWDYYCECIKI